MILHRFVLLVRSDCPQHSRDSGFKVAAVTVTANVTVRDDGLTSPVDFLSSFTSLRSLCLGVRCCSLLSPCLCGFTLLYICHSENTFQSDSLLLKRWLQIQHVACKIPLIFVPAVFNSTQTCFPFCFGVVFFFSFLSY